MVAIQAAVLTILKYAAVHPVLCLQCVFNDRLIAEVQ